MGTDRHATASTVTSSSDRNLKGSKGQRRSTFEISNNKNNKNNLLGIERQKCPR